MQKQNEDETLLFQAKNAEDGKQYMVAANFYKQLIDRNRNKPGCSEKMKEYTEKFTEMNSLSVKHEMKTFSYSTQIDEEKAKIIDDQIEKWANMPIFEVLGVIGNSNYFYPIASSVRATSTSTIPSTYQLVSLSSIDHKGNKVKGSSNGVNSWYYGMYHLTQGLVMKLYLLPLFEKLISNKKLTASKLIKFLNRDNITSPDNEIIIKHGINKFLKKDYISALHILVPRFESFFLDCCKLLGIKTIKINRGEEVSTETITFSGNHLKHEKFIKVWGDDFCEQINFVNFEPLGIKLRHQVAHGEVQNATLNYENSVLILYLYIATATRIIPIKK